MEIAFAAFTAFLVAALPLSVGVTKIVDTIRNLVDRAGKLPKVTWNVLALVVGLAVALGFEINLLAPIAAAIPALEDWSCGLHRRRDPDRTRARWDGWVLAREDGRVVLEGQGSESVGVSDYRIIARRSDKLLRQRFHVVCIATNGEQEWRTEQYRDKDYAVSFAQKWAAICDGNYIDET